MDSFYITCDFFSKDPTALDAHHSVFHCWVLVKKIACATTCTLPLALLQQTQKSSETTWKRRLWHYKAWSECKWMLSPLLQTWTEEASKEWHHSIPPQPLRSYALRCLDKKVMLMQFLDPQSPLVELYMSKQTTITVPHILTSLEIIETTQKIETLWTTQYYHLPAAWQHLAMHYPCYIWDISWHSSWSTSLILLPTWTCFFWLQYLWATQGSSWWTDFRIW
jgi:hypothetical protein